MNAFVTTFVPSTVCIKTSRLCNSRGYAAPARVLRAVISQDPSTEATERGGNEEEAFNWVENWYPVMPECDAPIDEPYAFTLFDREYVLFRIGVGRWSVLDDRCSHRLAPLSEGRIVRSPENDEFEIECAYHGWGFSGCGSCTRIPQLETDARIPRRAHVRSYRTFVDAGIIWMYLGDGLSKDAPSRPILPDVIRNMPDEIVQNAKPFMRTVPYDFETLIENFMDPEHVYWAHHGTAAASGGRSQGGTEVLSYEKLPRPHQIRLFRQGRRSIESVLIHPGIVSIEFLPNFVSIFLAVPSTRTQSRLFISTVNNRPKSVISSIFSVLPRWYIHLQNHNVLDGDNVFLRGVQRELPDPSKWKEKFLPLHSNCDKYVVYIREWMDKHRDGMPWGSEKRPLPDLPRSAMLDRYNSHVVHCKSCLGAFKGFERAIVIAEMLTNICLAILVSSAMIAVTGNIRPNQFKMVRISIIVVSVLLAASIFLRRFFCHMKQQFILTDNARKLLISS